MMVRASAVSSHMHARKEKKWPTPINPYQKIVNSSTANLFAKYAAPRSDTVCQM
jgi:hypothetical protein